MRDRGATRALVLGLLALPFGVFAPFAIWSGARSWRRIHKAGGELDGLTSAVAGLVAGLLAVVAFLVGTIYWLVAS